MQECVTECGTEVRLEGQIYFSSFRNSIVHGSTPHHTTVGKKLMQSKYNKKEKEMVTTNSRVKASYSVDLTFHQLEVMLCGAPRFTAQTCTRLCM